MHVFSIKIKIFAIGNKKIRHHLIKQNEDNKNENFCVVWGPWGSSRTTDRFGRIVLFMQSVELSVFTIDRNGSLIFIFVKALGERF